MSRVLSVEQIDNLPLKLREKRCKQNRQLYEKLFVFDDFHGVCREIPNPKKIQWIRFSFQPLKKRKLTLSMTDFISNSSNLAVWIKPNNVPVSSSPPVHRTRWRTTVNAATRHNRYGIILCANLAPPCSRNISKNIDRIDLDSMFNHLYWLAFFWLCDKSMANASITIKPNSFSSTFNWSPGSNRSKTKAEKKIR